MNRQLVAVVLLAVPALIAAHVADAAECLPKAGQAWIRMPPTASMPMMVGFARITNPCTQDVVFSGAESTAFAMVSLHESREVDGVNRMREVEALPVPAGRAVEMKPGGLHLMLYQPATALKEGGQVVISLKLKDGRSVPVNFTVRKAAP